MLGNAYHSQPRFIACADVVAARDSAGAYTQAACGTARGSCPRKEFVSCPGELAES